MRALVTGGGGFIGAWIIRRLLGQGAQIRVFDFNKDPSLMKQIVGDATDTLEWRSGDVSAGAAVADAARDCDLLVHLAAVLTPACKDDPIRGAEINLTGTLNVFEAAREHGINQVLYMSSAGVFGPDDGVTPRPTTHYGAFKLATEGCARAYWADHGIASAGFRPLVVYGPGRETGLTAGPTLACRAAATGESYVIPFSGETDFLFVDDIAQAFEAAARDSLVGAAVYNVAGEVCDVRAFAKEIGRIAPGANIRVEGPSLPIAPRIDPGKLREVYPNIQRTTIHEGIEATIAHYRRHR